MPLWAIALMYNACDKCGKAEGYRTAIQEAGLEPVD
jgi:hypothetical protein